VGCPERLASSARAALIYIEAQRTLTPVGPSNPDSPRPACPARHAPRRRDPDGYIHLPATCRAYRNPLRQTINESDKELYRAALAEPAQHAAIVLAFDGDAIDDAVKAHPTDSRLPAVS